MKYVAPIAEVLAVETVNVLLASQPVVEETEGNTCPLETPAAPCNDDE